MYHRDYIHTRADTFSQGRLEGRETTGQARRRGSAQCGEPRTHREQAMNVHKARDKQCDTRLTDVPHVVCETSGLDSGLWSVTIV